jgi:hypothetical protein
LGKRERGERRRRQQNKLEFRDIVAANFRALRNPFEKIDIWQPSDHQARIFIGPDNELVSSLRAHYMLVAASLMATEATDHLAGGQMQARRQQGGRPAFAVCRQQRAAAAAAKQGQRQNVPPSTKPPPTAGGLSAEAFLVLACVAVSLIVLPLVLPPLPPPPPLLLLVPVCLLLLLAALATFMPSDVRTMASSYL